MCGVLSPLPLYAFLAVYRYIFGFTFLMFMRKHSCRFVASTLFFHIASSSLSFWTVEGVVQSNKNK